MLVDRYIVLAGAAQLASIFVPQLVLGLNHLAASHMIAGLTLALQSLLLAKLTLVFLLLFEIALLA